MQDAPAVGVRDRLGKDGHQAGRFAPGHRSRPLAQPFGQCGARTVRRGDVEDGPCFPHLVHRHDVRMIEAGRRFGLAEEPPTDRLERQDFGAGHFKRDRRRSAGSSARKTTPKPPRPSSRTIEKRPNCRARQMAPGYAAAKPPRGVARIRARPVATSQLLRLLTDRRRRPGPRRRPEKLPVAFSPRIRGSDSGVMGGPPLLRQAYQGARPERARRLRQTAQPSFDLVERKSAVLVTDDDPAILHRDPPRATERAAALQGWVLPCQGSPSIRPWTEDRIKLE